MITISQAQAIVFRTAVEHGWWPHDIMEMAKPAAERKIDFDKVNIPEKLALMHSEISEALEHYRKEGSDVHKDIMFFDNGKPDGFWIELADCIIRILDLAGAYDIDMETLLMTKAEYNKTRPFRHGGKKA